MKISLKWINEFVDISDYFSKPEALGVLLTNAGLEVEEIFSKGQELKHVVIGLILEKAQHPDAEKLSVCKVSTGEGVVHQIVCGAKNHKADDRVIVALPGAVLPGNFAIKKSLLRGVESGGMLCSFKELGMTDASDGIAILPEDAPLGVAYAEWAGMDDIVFEIKVTPNRADCLSHLGLAREIACLLGRQIKTPEVKLQEADFTTASQVKLEILNKDMCPRYTGRVLRSVKVGPSPDWLVRKLEAVGQSSINNIVDVTNYVMFEMGQPLHAFDFAKIEGATVRVGTASEGQKFQTLDGTVLQLNGQELMIQSSERSMCMAGTIGGKDSGVSETTTNIFLESAYFAPQFVRKAARAHGLNTESSYRFTRGVDPRQTRLALDRAAELIQQVAGGEISREPYDLLSQDLQTPVIEITSQLIADRLGYAVDEAKLENYLLRLGCEVKKSGNHYQVKAPSWRVDIEVDVDLVEEYARLNGYEHIPETLPAFASYPTHHDPKYVRPLKVKDTLQGVGFHEAINFGFVSEEKQKSFFKDGKAYQGLGLSYSQESVLLMNPLADQMNVMRKSLFLGLLANASHNIHHDVLSGSLYEVGQVFFKEGDKFSESQRLALINWGQGSALWETDKVPAVFRLKTAIEKVFEALHITAVDWVKPEMETPGFLHTGQIAKIKVEGRIIGFIASLHPQLIEDMKLRGEVAYAELDLESLLKGKEKSYRVSGISKFPMVERDLALVMPKDMAAGDIIKLIKKATGPLLRSVEVFDVFMGESLGLGLKSVTFRIILTDSEQTLKEEVITQKMQAIMTEITTLGSVQVR